MIPCLYQMICQENYRGPERRRGKSAKEDSEKVQRPSEKETQFLPTQTKLNFNRHFCQLVTT